MKITPVELGIYRLKVDLFVHRYGERSGLFGTGRRSLAGSEVWLDQITPDGWCVFGLFSEDGSSIFAGHYVKCPTEILDDQAEEVLGKNGELRKLSYSEPK